MFCPRDIVFLPPSYLPSLPLSLISCLSSYLPHILSLSHSPSCPVSLPLSLISCLFHSPPYLPSLPHILSLSHSPSYPPSLPLSLSPSCPLSLPQPQGVGHLLEKDAFVSILDFLLGPMPKDVENRPQVTTPLFYDITNFISPCCPVNGVLQDKDKYGPRRWSSNQVKEFGPLHGTLSLLVRNTDISMFESKSAEGPEVIADNPYRIPGSHSDLRPPPESMHQALFSIDHSKRLIHEVQ